MLKYPKHPENAHVRTCQECGNTQTERKAPIYGGEPTGAYNARACKNCKSDSCLDYGKTNINIDDNNLDWSV